MEERLQKYLARAGVASRRRAEELITSGRVKINNTVVKKLGTKINPQADTVTVDNQPVKAEEKIYLLLNKPKGYITSLDDPQGRPVVTSLLKGVKQRVYPVGRLDFDSEGLLLVTNDGLLTHALTHPRYEIKKTYHAEVRGVPSREKLDRMAGGLELADGLTAPAEVHFLGQKQGRGLLEITIHEGRNRQIRRMCRHIGHPVIKLRRVRMGNLTVKDLPAGKYRELTPLELRKLKQLVDNKKNK